MNRQARQVWAGWNCALRQAPTYKRSLQACSLLFDRKVDQINDPSKLAPFPFLRRGWPTDCDLRWVHCSSGPFKGIAETVSCLRLAAGSGTTLVDQMRPAHGWRCRCPLFHLREARNGTSFGVADERRSVVEPKLGAGGQRLRYPGLFRCARWASKGEQRGTLHFLCKSARHRRRVSLGFIGRIASSWNPAAE
jgi:hypothetical protein